VKVMGKIIGGVAIACVVLAFLIWVGGISWNNTGISLEETTTAQVKQNKNLYDGFWKKVKEVAQVTQEYKGDAKDLYIGLMEARYPKGENPLMKWIQESNPTLDVSVYKKIQDVIEAGRNEFMRGQQDLADKQRRYKTHLRQFPGSLYQDSFDLPTILTGEMAPGKDLDDDGKLTVFDYPIVTSTKTETVFKEGKDDEALDVFGKKPAKAK